jgi:hypothetical protein
MTLVLFRDVHDSWSMPTLRWMSSLFLPCHLRSHLNVGIDHESWTSRNNTRVIDISIKKMRGRTHYFLRGCAQPVQQFVLLPGKKSVIVCIVNFLWFRLSPFVLSDLVSCGFFVTFLHFANLGFTIVIVCGLFDLIVSGFRFWLVWLSVSVIYTMWP